MERAVVIVVDFPCQDSVVAFANILLCAYHISIQIIIYIVALNQSALVDLLLDKERYHPVDEGSNAVAARADGEIEQDVESAHTSRPLQQIVHKLIIGGSLLLLRRSWIGIGLQFSTHFLFKELYCVEK